MHNFMTLDPAAPKAIDLSTDDIDCVPQPGLMLEKTKDNIMDRLTMLKTKLKGSLQMLHEDNHANDDTQHESQQFSQRRRTLSEYKRELVSPVVMPCCAGAQFFESSANGGNCSLCGLFYVVSRLPHFT